MLITSIIAIVITAFYVRLVEFCIKAWRKAVPIKESNSATISLTVVIAARNEEKNIETLINSLKNQTHKSFEVIIADDGSTDSTPIIIDKLTIEDNRFTVIQTSGVGKKHAQRQAIQQARNSIIVTIDADCVAQENWLQKVATYHAIYSPSMLIAPVEMTSTGGTLSHIMKLEFTAIQMITAGKALQERPIMCNGANLSFTKDEYFKSDLKGNYASGDDMFLLESMLQRGCKIGYLKDAQALVRTPLPKGIKAYLKQRSRWLRKASGYSQKGIINAALLIFIANMMWPILFLASIIGGNVSLAVIGLAALMFKLIADYKLLKQGEKFFSTDANPIKIIILEITYPIFIIAIAISSIVRNKRKW